MTLSEFLLLDEVGKGNAVWNGNFLTSRMEGCLTVQLYDLGGFYVEVYYNSEKNRIERLRPFRKISALGPYLDGFDINDLL